MELICRPIAERAARLRQVRRRTTVIGLCGPQGSGKTTLARAAARLLEERGLKAVAVSLDDFYLTRPLRQQLARDVHPLLATRGPPGTHDVAMALGVLDAARAPGRLVLPAFDKAADTRAPRTTWRTLSAPVDVVILEGWCVGARAQGAAALERPVNDLERDEDPQGVWRNYVNAQLDGPYQTLFARLHSLILLKPPGGFEPVAEWRLEQERKLRARTGGGMSDAEVLRFISHYERLTRWILSEMPERADWVARIAEDRAPLRA